MAFASGMRLKGLFCQQMVDGGMDGWMHSQINRRVYFFLQRPNNRLHCASGLNCHRDFT